MPNEREAGEPEIGSRRYLLSELQHALTRNEQLQRRVKAFQEGYRDKSFEVTALEIQILDLKAHGVDKVTARQNESLKRKLLTACEERNELREVAKIAQAVLTALNVGDVQKDSALHLKLREVMIAYRAALTPQSTERMT